jgi:hypothetical protein
VDLQEMLSMAAQILREDSKVLSVSEAQGVRCDGYALPTLKLRLRQQNRGVTAHLDTAMQFDSWPEWIVQDHTVGFGTSDRNALRDALRLLHRGPLAVLRHALLRQTTSQATEYSRLRIPGQDWAVFEGSFQLSTQNRKALEDRLAKQTPLGLLGRDLRPVLTPGRPHWLKIYGVRYAEGTNVWDCVLDNRPWQAGTEALLAAFDWPEDHAHHILRNAAALVPLKPERPRRGG